MCLLFCRCETISHSFFCFFFFLMIRRPPRSTLFPYTTLFRSTHAGAHSLRVVGDVSGGLGTRLAPHELVEYELGDRKSTRLNSSHLVISYAVFCLKKKKKKDTNTRSYKTNTTKVRSDSTNDYT